MLIIIIIIITNLTFHPPLYIVLSYIKQIIGIIGLLKIYIYLIKCKQLHRKKRSQKGDKL